MRVRIRDIYKVSQQNSVKQKSEDVKILYILSISFKTINIHYSYVSLLGGSAGGGESTRVSYKSIITCF